MASPAVATVVVPRQRDLGDGFMVRRAVPSAECRAVGPFVFFDQMGPTVFTKGAGLDVRPHPHIGLATVTYLFAGEILHRDSLGTVQAIRPGEVNWMTAGRGIVHSERTPAATRMQDQSRLFGVQTWVALPQAQEEAAPAFAHHMAEELPVIEESGKRLRVIVGTLDGAHAPVEVFSAMFYADATLAPGARLNRSIEHEQRAVYVAEGRVDIAGASFDAGRLVVLRPGSAVVVAAADASRLLMFGGEPLDGPRHLWWNFVSSSQERIEMAKEDWRAGRFPPVPNESDFIPLPEATPSNAGSKD
jgi:redox-sensitive bicupin YhaK (pirin superfamily)